MARRSTGCPRLAQSTVVASLDQARQLELIDQVRSVCKASPLVRPFTAGGNQMRVRISAAGTLGWVADGKYRYSKMDSRGKPWPPIPQAWLDIANDVAGHHPWDCAIINWYDEGASLGWHRDQDEADLTLPIVTISLGDSCDLAVRMDENSPISRALLYTGDVTLFAGPTRMILHAIERIIPNPLFSPLGVRGRISITIRVAGWI